MKTFPSPFRSIEAVSHRRALAVVALYLLTVLIFTFVSYVQTSRYFIQRMDEKMLTAATLTLNTLHDFLGDNLLGKKPLSFEEDVELAMKLQAIADQAGVQYVYSMIKRDDTILFTSSNPTEEELRTGEYEAVFLVNYGDAGNAIHEAFSTGTAKTSEYEDQWGAFRSIYMPLTAESGERFVIGVDTNFDEVSEAVRLSFLWSLLLACVLALIAFPLIRSLLRGIRAEAAYEAKNQFFASMSHEIRTPLNGVIGMAELLDDQCPEPQQKKHLDVIRQSGTALLGIIDDILDFAKLEADKMRLQLRPVSLESLLEEVIALFRPQAQAKGLALETRVRNAAPELILADPIRLRQVLYNLLGNALKFTPAGKIVITLDYYGETEPGDHDGRVRVEVMDTGVGIAEEDQPKLFHAFEQAREARSIKGTGLGLVICRRIVALMGGDLSFRSELGHGSAFWFEWPVSEAQADGRGGDQKTGSADDAVASIKARVLVVDDNPVNLQVAKGYMDKLGCEATLTLGGAEALSLIRGEHFDLLLMDCEMDDLDGYETTRRIRQWEADTARGRTPIVALSAHVMEEARERCVEAGMDDFLGKPIVRSDLYEKLAQWIDAEFRL